MIHRFFSFTVAFLLITVSVAACSTPAGTAIPPTAIPSTLVATPFTVISTSSNTTAVFPKPTGRVVLTITGKHGAMNVDGKAGLLELDIETLESMGLTEYRVMDAQAEGKVVTFRGVLISDLLKVVKAQPEVKLLKFVALDDYKVDIPIIDPQTYPVMIATLIEGQRMDQARRGPTRVVYPVHAFRFDPTVYDARWIWTLKSLALE